MRVGERSFSVDWMAKASQHTAEQSRTHVRAEAAAERRDARSRLQTVDFAEGNDQHAALVEADELSKY